MRVSLNWLKEFIDLDLSAEELAHELTMLGLEIEAIDRPGAEISQVVVGQIQSIDPHPEADKLVVCKTDVGTAEPLQIICGAKNMKAGDKVPTAVVGATLPNGFTIGRRKMRGLESFGMMCSARELGLGDDHAGLLIMSPDAPVGHDVKPLLGLDDVIVEIEVTPNRGDWAGMIGVARELSAHFRRPYRLPDATVSESEPAARTLSSVTIEAPDLCPRYMGRIIRNVKIGPSPDWLVRRLLAAGQRSINNVVDVTNYILMETGHPLHAFDLDKLEERRIVVRRAKAGESITTIDGEERRLDENMLVIADARVPVAVAGVMGGFHSEVGADTVNIFLESAFFLPTSVRKTARALGLQTEASARFQRGADPEMAAFALERAARLIQETAGGETATGCLDAYPNPLPRTTLSLRYERTRLLLGVDVPLERQQEILHGLGFVITNRNEHGFDVVVPTWRHDVAHEADLIEEIARLHGYDTIDTTVPRVQPSERVFAPEERAAYRLRHRLLAQGLTEAMTMSFSSVDECRRAGLPEDYLHMVRLANPLSENASTMRTTLIPGLLNVASHNLRRGVRSLAVFEIGPVYRPEEQDAPLPTQSTRLAILLSGTAGEKHWSRSEERYDFYDLKGQVEAVFDHFALSPNFAETNFPVYSPSECGAVVHESTEIGWFGRVQSSILKAFDLGQEVYLFELELDTLLQSSAMPVQFRPIPQFPPSYRDLAVLVDEHLPAGSLLATARKVGGPLLKRVRVFDIYTGKQVPNGQKSVALELIFQSEERTLTDADTEKAVGQILGSFEKEFNAQLR